MRIDVDLVVYSQFAPAGGTHGKLMIRRTHIRSHTAKEFSSICAIGDTTPSRSDIPSHLCGSLNGYWLFLTSGQRLEWLLKSPRYLRTSLIHTQSYELVRILSNSGGFVYWGTDHMRARLQGLGELSLIEVVTSEGSGKESQEESKDEQDRSRL